MLKLVSVQVHQPGISVIEGGLNGSIQTYTHRHWGDTADLAASPALLRQSQLLVVEEVWCVEQNFPNVAVVHCILVQVMTLVALALCLLAVCPTAASLQARAGGGPSGSGRGHQVRPTYWLQHALPPPQALCRLLLCPSSEICSCCCSQVTEQRLLQHQLLLCVLHKTPLSHQHRRPFAGSQPAQKASSLSPAACTPHACWKSCCMVS